MISYLILVSLLLQTSQSINPCCTGENRIIKRKCVDGTNVSGLTCPRKYITEPEKEITIDENDNMIIATSVIPPDRYCSTILNSANVYLVCFSETPNSSAYFDVYFVNAILELISVGFLIVTIVVYLQVPDLLDLQGICILHSISGLAVSFIVLASNQLMTTRMEKKICVSFAYITYFSMLYAFFWLNALSFHIWRTVTKPKCLEHHRFWPFIYHLFGIGGPVALLILLIIAHSMQYSDIHPGFGETKCWFKSTKVQFIYFYAPMAVLLCLNIVYYGWTIAVLWRDLNKCDEKKAKVLKYRVILCVKLFFIMGILWIFELLSAALQDVNPVLQVIWSITDCLNTLQGILIFLILVVFRKRVIRGLANRSFCGVRLPQKWRTVADDECEEIEEEFGLSETQIPKN